MINKYEISVSDFITCRQVLNIMVILGFMLNYALRVNLTIAIVAMVTTAKNATVDVLTNITSTTVVIILFSLSWNS